MGCFRKLLLLIMVVFFPLQAHAEYYLVCPDDVPNMVYIDGSSHKHYSRHTYERNDGFSAYHPTRMKNPDPDYIQDMATGDDDASQYPDMQIN